MAFFIAPTWRLPAPLPRTRRHSPRAQQRPPQSRDPTPTPPDWRSFRARLVQSERQTSPGTSSSSAGTDWAHEVSFIEAGCLLIASPEHFVGEHACSFFANSVVLVLSHGLQSGTIGVILNRPVGQAVYESRLRAELDRTPAPLYLGGPVALDSLLAVHDDESVPGAVRVVEGVAMSGVGEVLRRVDSGGLGREQCRLFCGYSGWAEGQLQEEVEQGVWYTAACCTEVFMRGGGERDLVRRVLRLMGGRFGEIGERLDDKEGGRKW